MEKLKEVELYSLSPVSGRLIRNYLPNLTKESITKYTESDNTDTRMKTKLYISGEVYYSPSELSDLNEIFS